MNKINKKLFGDREPIIGWTIILLSFVFIGLAIDPLINDTKEFLRIVGMLIIGGLIPGLLLMMILKKLLTKD